MRRVGGAESVGDRVRRLEDDDDGGAQRLGALVPLGAARAVVVRAVRERDDLVDVRDVRAVDRSAGRLRIRVFERMCHSRSQIDEKPLFA